MPFRVLVLAALARIAVANGYDDTPPFIPIRYSYGGYPKVMADLKFGTPEQESIPSVVDLGSANFWVYSANATFNYGGRGPFAQGPCNITVKPAYDPTSSRTSTELVPKENYGFSYGNGGKAIAAYGIVNDTIGFGEGVPCLTNQQVAVSNYSTSNQPAAANCEGADTLEYDHSILGISRFNNPSYPTSGPSFRQDLLDTGKISTATMSMWFDKHDGPVNETLRGTVLFGAVPEGKYSGKLTRVPLSPPETYVGYYVATPKIDVVSVKGESGNVPTSNDTTNCLIDSGFGTEQYPIDQDTFLNTTGLILYNGFPAFDGHCDDIPHSAAINFTFAGLNKNESVTVSVPLRNYARGNSDYLGDLSKCALSLEVALENNCYLGAAFTSGLFLAVNDDKDQFAMAQGGVSEGADKGTEGLGKVHKIEKGEDLPCK